VGADPVIQAEFHPASGETVAFEVGAGALGTGGMIDTRAAL
jgi:hypothetical protein